MTLKSEFHDEVKAACQAYIESVQQGEDEVPTETIYQFKKKGVKFREPKEVARPSLALRRNPGEHYNGEFETVAKDLALELEFDMVPEVDIDKDGIAGVAHTKLEEKLEECFREFAGVVMDYAGDFDFDETAFETAFDRQFEPEYTDRKKYEIIVPIEGVHSSSNISLDTDLSLDTDFDGPYSISHIEITDISRKEQNGIISFKTPSDAQGTKVIRDKSHSKAIRIGIERRRRDLRSYLQGQREEELEELSAESISLLASDTLSWLFHSHIVRELVNTLEQTLHLYNPRCEPGFGTGYLLAPNWLDYRGISSNIADEFYVERDGGHGVIDLESENSGDFQSFWNRYASYFTGEESPYDKPMVRFEEMFTKRRDEDAVLDCLIALEGTLLMGTRRSSYTFRIGLRGSLLLDNSNRISWDRERIRNFLQGLYSVRGEIVHQDKPLEQAINASENDELTNYSAPQLTERARVVFSSIILRYIDHDIDHGLAIQEVNQDLDEAAYNASYSPGSS
ncbi:HEPN domain-containing protein [Halorussus litoreus]|uniref:HEPN domain-containing protein n=1 Tax=Halorussus litoreus TaxID=1710536 RepID=UPI000E247633|nr:HEPN domain-containing protein [Halorussus litoreus]